MCVPGEEEEEQPVSPVVYKVLTACQDLPFEGTERGCEHILMFPLSPYLPFPLQKNHLGHQPGRAWGQALGLVALSYCRHQLPFFPLFSTPGLLFFSSCLQSGASSPSSLLLSHPKQQHTASFPFEAMVLSCLRIRIS